MRHLIGRLGHQGDGIADGPVFAARVLPGEVIEGDVVGDRIAAPKIVTSSDQRVTAPCAHYRTCGGCALQHASDGFVADWKSDVVRRALEAQGMDAPFRPILTSPEGTRRRATFAGRRLKKGVLVGFHGRSSDILTAVPECRIIAPGLRAALPALEALTALAASRKSEARLTVTASEAGADVHVATGQPLTEALRIALAEVARAHDLARLSWGDEAVVIARAPFHRFGTARVVPPPGAFLQATAEGEAALLGCVREAVGDARRIVDLFAGCGTFALPLASGAEVHAVESDAAMLAALQSGWRGGDGLKSVTVQAQDLFRRPLEGDDLRGFDAAVIDPPRAGAEAQTRALAAARIPRIAAVSCNPVTFARDAKLLIEAGYRLEWVQVIDQFRWSTHIELAAGFALSHIRGV